MVSLILAAKGPLMSLRRYLATSESLDARIVRSLVRGVRNFTLPVPVPIVRPILWTFVTTRAAFHFARRVLICEPLFKAYCTRYGKRVRTGIFIHWVQGSGELIVGDDVLVDGRCSFSFAARFADRPRLSIGDQTGIGHNCSFTVGKSITIGRHCKIASDVWIFDSSGHPADPSARLAGQPPTIDEVRPVTVGDNVWIGRRSIIFPGVSIGEGSVVSAGSVVTMDVPSLTVVAGNPARRVMTLVSKLEQEHVAHPVKG